MRIVILDLSSIDISSIIKDIEDFFLKDIIDLINQSFNSNQEIIKNIHFENYRSSVSNFFDDNKLEANLPTPKPHQSPTQSMFKA